MLAVTTDYTRGLSDLFPIENRHVVKLYSEPLHDLIDFSPVRSEFGNSEQQRRPRSKASENLTEFLFVGNRVAAVVAPEEHHRSVPVVIAQIRRRNPDRSELWKIEAIENFVTEVNKPADFCLDFHHPAQRNEYITQLSAMT